MDAEFFCLNSDLKLAGRLLGYLNEFVDPTIALRVVNVEEGSGAERGMNGDRYSKLLHASIPPERELSIEAVTRIELFGSRIYFRVYWPMLVEGTYSIPGVEERIRGLYWTTYQRQFHLWDHGLDKFLPALAIRDRMILVPKGQTEVLESMGTNEPAPAPLERGILEVDFQSWSELELAMVRVGDELRRELRQELLAYNSFNLSDRDDFDAVCARLGVPPSLLRRALRDETDAKELIYRQLRCTLTPSTIVKEVQTRMALRIENPSSVDIGRVRVQMRGPSTGIEVTPDRVTIELGALDTAVAHFSVAANQERGLCLRSTFS